MNNNPKKIYIALKYSGCEEYSFAVANTVLSHLMKRGDVVPVSVISMTHTAAKVHNLPTDAKYWETFNFALLASCDEMIVVVNEVLNDSTSLGVQAEIKEAQRLGIPVTFWLFGQKVPDLRNECDSRIYYEVIDEQLIISYDEN